MSRLVTSWIDIVDVCLISLQTLSPTLVFRCILPRDSCYWSSVWALAAGRAPLDLVASVLFGLLFRAFRLIKHRWGTSALGIWVLVHYFRWICDFAQLTVGLGGSLELIEVWLCHWELSLLRGKSARVEHILRILCHGRFRRQCIREKIIFLRGLSFLRLGLLFRTIYWVIWRRLDQDLLLSGGLATDLILLFPLSFSFRTWMPILILYLKRRSQLLVRDVSLSFLVHGVAKMTNLVHFTLLKYLCFRLWNPLLRGPRIQIWHLKHYHGIRVSLGLSYGLLLLLLQLSPLEHLLRKVYGAIRLFDVLGLLSLLHVLAKTAIILCITFIRRSHIVGEC